VEKSLECEDVWAQVVFDGETVEQAIKRGVKLLKESKARLAKQGKAT
jgi:hypothetical protein